MQNIEFLGYKSYPEDQYVLGIATIRVLVVLDPNRTTKLTMRYKHVARKDGTSTFFSLPDHSLTDRGEKKFLGSAVWDSRTDEEEIIDFLRDKVRQYTAPLPRSMDEVAAAASITGSSTKGAAVEEQLPF